MIDPDARMISDKMPANFFYIGLIHKFCPMRKSLIRAVTPMIFAYQIIRAYLMKQCILPMI